MNNRKLRNRIKKILQQNNIPISHWYPSRMIRGAGHSTPGVEISKPYPNADYYRLDVRKVDSEIIRQILTNNKINFKCDINNYPTIIKVPMDQKC